MRTLRFAFTLALALVWTSSWLLSQQKNLNPEQQAAFLSKRTSGAIIGTFDSYCGLLYAVNGVAIHTESTRINKTRLSPASPKFYQPTWKELFDSIAAQTKSSWNYDPVRGYWVFGEPQRTLPYKLQISPSWRADDHGIEINYRPPIAPVGMDVYWMGTYSVDKGEDAANLFARVRSELAMLFARDFEKNVTAKDMRLVHVGKSDALYFQAPGPSGVTWRQWILVDKGQAFAIVSAIKPEQEKQLLPEVQAMLDSFEVTDGQPSAASSAVN